MKRAIDVLGSAAGLLFLWPVILPFVLLIWLQDGHFPFYVAPRVGKGKRPFMMVKLRSMTVDAHKLGWDSTKADDPRVTRIGSVIRRYKLDEVPQLWNVLKGDMSLVGPRPNVQRETDLYTPFEVRLLEVRPGVTDFSSIVFTDLAEILKGQEDPNLAYREIVRPWKSRLGVFYVERRSAAVDLHLIWLTAVGVISWRRAHRGVQRLLRRLGASRDLIEVAGRELGEGARLPGTAMGGAEREGGGASPSDSTGGLVRRVEERGVRD